VIAAVAVGAWAFTRPRPEPIGIVPTPSTIPADPAQAALDEAKHLCDQGDCDTAHEKIVNEIPPSSPLRESADFKAIEVKWADGILARAETEPDVGKKRSLLDRVSRSPTVDAQRRKAAADKLQFLDDAAMNPSVLPVASTRDAGGLRASNDGGTRRVSTPHEETGSQATSSPVSTSLTPKQPSGAGMDIERLRQLMLQGPSGETAARALLEPKVFANRASGEEIRMLKAICKDQHDQVCVEKCKSLLNQ
jgi:hypothetical protein